MLKAFDSMETSAFIQTMSSNKGVREAYVKMLENTYKELQSGHGSP